jgi:hypothetical protein
VAQTIHPTPLRDTHRAPQTAFPAQTWLRVAGIVVVAVSLFGAIFPYFSEGVGLPLDGAPDGAMTTWRTVLHLIPGVVGVAGGLYLLAWGRRGPSRPPLGARRATLAVRSTVVAGGWFCVGPYLWAIVSPEHAVGTGGMAGTMTTMKMSWIGNVIMPVTEGLAKVDPKMTTVTCAFTMGVCHWAVGALVVLGGLAAMGIGLGKGPLSGLSAVAEPTPTGVGSRS